ncbi:MAG: class I SAM-dependent methyltransferase [Polyangiaceae bacterium]
MAVVSLKPGHVQPVWAGHPWVYAQAVARVSGGARAGDEVEVVDAQSNLLGRGLYSPGSAIAVRMYTRDKSTRIDAALFERRIASAIERRKALGLPSADTDAYRVIHAEGDELPGLVVDRYGDVLVVQTATIGIKQREETLFAALVAALSPRAILDRTSERAAKTEGFELRRGVVYGDETLNELAFSERGFRYRIPLELGQKTGFYVDQRDLRARVEELARGKRVLDAFSYVGAISMAAARGGATAVRRGSSALALEVAAECARENGCKARISSARARGRPRHAGAGRAAGRLRPCEVVCDPPKLAPSRAAKKRALGAMRRLAAAGARATRWAAS